MESPLRKLRTTLDLTQEALAVEIQVGQSQVSEHERTGKGIGHGGLIRLADRYRKEMVQLGITVEDLIRWRPESVEPAA